jgi:hypothetical protein
MRVAFGWRSKAASHVTERATASRRIHRRWTLAAVGGLLTLFLLASAERALAQDWTLTKTPSPPTYTAAGQTITYTYVITDIGGSIGTLFSLTDNRVAPANISCPSNNIPPNGTLTCTGAYTTTNADVAAGFVTNTATATGDSCNNDGCNVSVQAQATITLLPQPSWTLTKTPTPSTYTAAGQTINYSYATHEHGQRHHRKHHLIRRQDRHSKLSRDNAGGGRQRDLHRQLRHHRRRCHRGPRRQQSGRRRHPNSRHAGKRESPGEDYLGGPAQRLDHDHQGRRRRQCDVQLRIRGQRR